MRQEIAELTEKNRFYSLSPKHGSDVADNERRFQRLIEIVEELKRNIQATSGDAKSWLVAQPTLPDQTFTNSIGTSSTNSVCHM